MGFLHINLEVIQKPKNKSVATGCVKGGVVQIRSKYRLRSQSVTVLL